MATRTTRRSAAQAAATKSNTAAEALQKNNNESEKPTVVKAVSKRTPKPKAKSKPAPKAKVKPHLDILPHGLGVKASEEDVTQNGLNEPLAQDSQKSKETQVKVQVPSKVGDDKPTDEKPRQLKKASQYGIQLGKTPYPDLARPTPEECQRVRDLLTKEHGEVAAPETIAAPSLTVAGCGEVKFVLEAIIRTHISAHTSMGNANRAIKGLTAKFPLIKEGPYTGSVDWNAVRLSPQPDLEDAIRGGGMAPTKSKAIKRILDMVYEENQQLKAELAGSVESKQDVKMEDDEATLDTKAVSDEESKGKDASTRTDKNSDLAVYASEDNSNIINEPASSKQELTTEIKDESDRVSDHAQGTITKDEGKPLFNDPPKTPLEVLQQSFDASAVKTREAVMSRLAKDILTTDSPILTLDYIHAMDEQSAFNKLLSYPGIGVKTAACTLLFCMQRPLFAVDTHVYRICKYLGWVPQNASRDTTFAHCDVRCPDELKYGLHQLLIKHGKVCGKCRAVTGESSKGWEEECVLEELVTRTGKKKGGVDLPKAKRKKVSSEDEVDEEQDGLPKKKTKGMKSQEKNGKAAKSEVAKTSANGQKNKLKTAAKSKKVAAAKGKSTSTRSSSRTKNAKAATDRPEDEVESSGFSEVSTEEDSEFEE